MRAVHAPRAALAEGMTLDGPAVITQPDATCYVPPEWRAMADAAGNLELTPR